MKRITLLFAASVLCFSQAARAEDSGAYLGAGIAWNPMMTACDNTVTTCNNVTTDSDRAAEPSLLVGYDFNKFVGIEGGWARLGSYKLQNTAGTAFIGSVQGSAVTLGVKGGYKFHFGLSVFGKLGLAQVSTQYTPGPGWALTMNNSQKSTGTLMGVGVQYDFNDTIGARFTFEDVTFSDPALKGDLFAGHFMAIFKL